MVRWGLVGCSQIQILAVLITNNSVTLGKSLNLSVPYFLIRKKGIIGLAHGVFSSFT